MYKLLTRFAATGLVMAALAMGSLASANAQTVSSASPAPHTSAHFVKMPGSAVARLARAGLATRSASTARMARALTRVEAASGAAADQINCFDGVAILANANGDFVSAELGYSGGDYAMLRARATAIGPWETYGLCRDNSTGLTNVFSDANGDFVSAELGYTGSNYGEVRARATAIGPWEDWYTGSDPCGGCSTYFYNGANGRYASAEIGYTGGRYGELRARATSVGPWEVYYW